MRLWFIAILILQCECMSASWTLYAVQTIPHEQLGIEEHRLVYILPSNGQVYSVKELAYADSVNVC